MTVAERIAQTILDAYVDEGEVSLTAKEIAARLCLKTAEVYRAIDAAHGAVPGTDYCKKQIVIVSKQYPGICDTSRAVSAWAVSRGALRDALKAARGR